MSFFPCSAHGKIFRGAAEHAYPAIVGDNDGGDRRHLRLCHNCMEQYREFCAQWLSLVDYDSPEDHNFDTGCFTRDNGEHIGELIPVFVTTYPRHLERADFYGQTCAHHANEAVQLFTRPIFPDPPPDPPRAKR